MIIINNKICFVHIPKTSGSSFTKIVLKYISNYKKNKFTNGPGWQGTWHFNNGFCNGQHANLNILNMNDINKIKNLTIITIVRNPYDWIGSIYLNFMKKKFKSFKHYLLFLKNKKKLGKGKGWSNNLLQYDFIKNNSNLKIKIYKFEENPHQKICDDYNLEYLEIHELNRNRNKLLDYNYDNEMINLVNLIFNEDFKRFNYKKINNVDELKLMLMK